MKLSGVALLAPFGIAGFAGLWVSASAGSFARTTTQLAFSWLTLQATDSPFLVGVVAAARMAPQLVLGIPAGIVADYVDRRTLLVGVNVAATLLLLAVLGAALAGVLSWPAILATVAAFGVLDTLRTATTQAYAYDLVRAARATSGMALTNLGAQLLGTLGGLVGGWTLERFGGPAAFALIAVVLAIAAVAPLVTGRPAIRDVDSTPSSSRGEAPSASTGEPRAAPNDRLSGSSTNAVPASSPTGPDPVSGDDAGDPSRERRAVPRARPNFGQAATLLVRNRLLAILALAILVAEILGFATQTLLPTFARDVFDVGAAGLGTMTAVRSGGGVLGLLLVARLGAGVQGGLLFVAACTTLGVALLLFAVSPAYALALVLLAVAGGASSAMDTLGQTLLQRNADERERGAAMGIWVFAVGFGPIGHLTLGAAAEAFGAPRTQLVSGALLALVGIGLALNGPLRRAR